ncbi:hypothetical protein [Sphingomonas sp. BK235]|uniref:hypothetical protein n=1 Tax=Sphingomonas sp. BK235 TaxID=2512131 RepID=UPI001049FD73|nr:hypothetical protein [Sphingomonas sp. BK235]TCP36559.1 hypothetical protein EV292_10155 [Sphingomonas sp. BK235]
MRWVLGSAGLVLVCVVLALAVVGIKSCAEQPDITTTVVEPAREAGMAAAAVDGTAITAKVMVEAAEADTATLENDRVIRSTPGAAATVPAAVTAAGLRAQCMRQAYSRDPRCASVLATGRQPAR